MEIKIIISTDITKKKLKIIKFRTDLIQTIGHRRLMVAFHSDWGRFCLKKSSYGGRRLFTRPKSLI